MPKFYCEYCGIYLTHSSPSGRSQHAKGRKHINNRIEYYKQVIEDINKENQDKIKQMQSGQQFLGGLPLFPGSFQNLNQLPLQQLSQLKAGGIQQVQISSNQQANTPLAQPPIPGIQPQFMNLAKLGGQGIPPGAGIPQMRPGQQPPMGPPPIGMAPPNQNVLQPPLMPPGGLKMPGLPPMGHPGQFLPQPAGPQGLIGVTPQMSLSFPPHHLGGSVNQPMDMQDQK